MEPFSPYPIITISSDHPWLEVVFWISQIVLVVIAAAAAYFGYHHVKETARRVGEAEETRKQELKISHANLIMSLDVRWDGERLTEARTVSVNIREDVNKRISAVHPLAGDAEKLHFIRAEWKKVMAEMREKDRDSYMKLLSICGFFETVGLLVKGGYIRKDDVFGLFFGPIMLVDRCFRDHIEERAIEMGVPNGFLEHALYLCDLAKAENPNP